MLEYAQTEQDRWDGDATGHRLLSPPEGSGWSLHSWRPNPQNSTKLLIVWQRETRGGTQRPLPAR